MQHFVVRWLQPLQPRRRVSIWAVVDVFGRACCFAHALQFIDKAPPVRPYRREASHIREEQRFKLVRLNMRDETVRPPFAHFGYVGGEHSFDRAAPPNRLLLSKAFSNTREVGSQPIQIKQRCHVRVRPFAQRISELGGRREPHFARTPFVVARRCLPYESGPCLVPVWPITLSGGLPIVALVCHSPWMSNVYRQVPRSPVYVCAASLNRQPACQGGDTLLFA